MPNLEPIEEKDLNLKDKFVEKIGTENPANDAGPKIENIVTVEQETSAENQSEKENFYEGLMKQIKGQSHPAIEKQVPIDANTIAQYEDVEKKIDELVNIAVHKNVMHAVKVARHLDDNYTLDELHGRLHGEVLYEELLKKGLIKKL
jgi:hypothetical protein